MSQVSQRLEQKKILLIALSDAEARRRLESAVLKHFPGTTVFQAGDGAEAWMKMTNLPPHVLILERSLLRMDAIEIAQRVLSEKAFLMTGVLFVNSAPENETFVDDIVTGRVQFLGDGAVTEVSLVKALSRSFNSVAERESTEFKLRFLVPGDRLIRQGESSRNVFLVRRGRLKACLTEGGRETLLGEVETGEFVGEMAYINNEPRSADVIALTECELIEIPADHLDHSLFRKPSWAKALMVTLSKRVKRANADQTRA